MCSFSAFSLPQLIANPHVFKSSLPWGRKLFFSFFFFCIVSATCCTLDKLDALQLYIWHLCYTDLASMLAKPYLSCSRVLPACHQSNGSAVRCMQKALLAIENSCKSYWQVLQSVVVTDHGVHSYPRVIHSCQNGNQISFLVTHFF